MIASRLAEDYSLQTFVKHGLLRAWLICYAGGARYEWRQDAGPCSPIGEHLPFDLTGTLFLPPFVNRGRVAEISSA